MTFDCFGSSALAPVLDGADRDHDDVVDRAINRVLTTKKIAPDARSTSARPRAIFRVVLVAGNFAYTRTITGVDAPGHMAISVQSASFATERAAYELAKRAAARFQVEHPGFLVGLVGIDPAPEPPAPKRQLRDEINERRDEARRKRQRERYARIAATPEGRAQISERARENYARRVDTPERRERLNARARKWPAGGNGLIACVDAGDGPAPTCGECGKPTGIRYGRPLRFCPRAPGEKRSACLIRHSNRLRGELLKSNPEARAKHNQQQRDYALRFPEKNRQRRIKDQERRRNNPRQYAAKLEAERLRKARVRAEARALRQAAERPTGSVLLTAAPNAPGRELLASIYAEVSPRLPPHLRMEIISEAVLLHLEGADMKLAVSQARKNVNKGADLLRYAKPIEDCFWLADESILIPGASS